jgi:hypothetical protein
MVDIDQSSGSFMPFYDEDTQVRSGPVRSVCALCHSAAACAPMSQGCSFLRSPAPPHAILHICRSFRAVCSALRVHRDRTRAALTRPPQSSPLPPPGDTHRL